MKCPACPTERLVISERHGIEIDYCPSCRGIWLDRGELDKIIERAAPGSRGPDDARRGGRDDGDGVLGWIFDLFD